MTKDRFIEICREVDYPEECIEETWRTRPPWVDGDRGLQEEGIKAALAIAALAIHSGMLDIFKQFIREDLITLKAQQKASRN